MKTIKENKKALVVEGGGMRGIFTTGVLDSFLSSAFDPFDMYFGVSVGASTLSSFLAGQFKRHFRIFTEMACRPEFMSLKRMITGGSYMDLDWLWNTVEASSPLDTPSIDLNLKGKECYIVCTHVETGKPLYLSPWGKEWIGILKASSAIPLLYKHFPQFEGAPLADGGVSDPIPVMEAYNKGARHIVVIRTRPVNARKEAWLTPAISSMFFNNTPQLKEEIRSQARRYNETLDFMESPPSDLTITQIAPQTAMKTRRTSKQNQFLINDYSEGVKRGLHAIDILDPKDQQALTH
ncbi:MAG: patatin family protein [Proteobacteria bacterium]|nr:patatin family protein [Pseudomonadota bacterium]